MEDTDLGTILSNLTTKYYDLLKEYNLVQEGIQNLQTQSRQISLQIRETKSAMSRLQEIQINSPHLSDIQTTQLPDKNNKSEVRPASARKINFGSLKVIKHLKTGGKSKYVHLLEKHVVKKRYDRTNIEHVKAYHREVTILNHLRECPFVPNILHLTPEKYIIYMNYCGEHPYETKSSFQKISQLARKLNEDYGVFRINPSSNNISYKIQLHNCCWDGADYFLIDFGSPHWRIKGKILPS